MKLIYLPLFFVFTFGNLRSQTYEIFPITLHDSISYTYRQIWSSGGSINGTVSYYISDSTIVNDTTIHWTVIETANNIFDYQPQRIATLILKESLVGMHKLQCDGVVWAFPSLSYAHLGDYPKVYRYSNSVEVVSIGVSDADNKDTLWLSEEKGFYMEHKWLRRYRQAPPYGVYTIDISIQRTDLTTSVRPPESASRIADFSLHANYPNPFNSQTTISFDVSLSGFVSLSIYDVLGRNIHNLVEEVLPRGRYSRSWDASAVNSGVYIAQLKVGSRAETVKLIHIK